jgi:hypothetical protein
VNAVVVEAPQAACDRCGRASSMSCGAVAALLWWRGEDSAAAVVEMRGDGAAAVVEMRG